MALTHQKQEFSMAFLVLFGLLRYHLHSHSLDGSNSCNTEPGQLKAEENASLSLIRSLFFILDPCFFLVL